MILAQAIDRPAQSMSWRVNGLRLAGLAWGSPPDRPLLALHGFMDNAASFSYLATALAEFHVVAPDLAGHGKSDWRSIDAGYLIWDDLSELLGIVDALGWETFDLVGHSRGAIVATLLASAVPERVRRLVLLDAVAPEAVAEARFPLQLRTALYDRTRLVGQTNRVFASAEEAVRTRTDRGLSLQAATLLVRRNLRSCAGGVTWTTDPRIRGASAVKLTQGQIDAVIRQPDRGAEGICVF